MNHPKSFCEALPSEIKLIGHSGKESTETYLRAGRLTMMFREGALRYIAAGSDELIRMIYAAVRVKDWITIKPVFSDEKYDIKPDSFLIKYTCNYLSEEVDFTARYELTGSKDNSLDFSMEGLANRSFLKNRIGFCILHPIINCAGITCNIEHADGSFERSSFPEEISPHQIFRDIKSMSWQINRTNCRIDLEGDVFETEDQRNWTDSSFKTYSTPLSIPYPVQIEKGKRIYQRIKFHTEGRFATPSVKSVKTMIRLNPSKVHRIPSIGICRTDNPFPVDQEEIDVLRFLHFDHYRVDLHLFRSDWHQKAEIACSESSKLGWPFEIALFIDDNADEQVSSFMHWYSVKRPQVSSILILHKSQPSTPDQIAKKIIPLLRETGERYKIATGTNASFAQLNRNRPGDTTNDYICYSIHPQEHASDNLTLVENLAAQEYSVKSALKFPGKKGVIISPVTLQRRFNPNSTLIELPWSGSGMPPQVDSRMMSMFGACWTTGSLKYLCQSGAESITYYNTIGERGLIQVRSDSQWPSHFQSVKGMIFPVYFVFKYLLDHKELHLVENISSNPLSIDALSLSDGKKIVIILVNFTGKSQPVNIYGCSGIFKIISLGADNFCKAVSDFHWTGIEEEKVINSSDSIRFEPYSVNFIEGRLKY